jgi:hypothetical protein
MTSEENREQVGRAIEMPAPTPWPLIAALGVTLGFAGLVTNAIVSIVGVVLALTGALGWWRDVLPHEKHEQIPLRPLAQRAKPVQPARQAVEHLTLGEAGHRVRVPAEIHPYSSGIKGGIVGGIAMAIVALLYGLIAQGSLWYPINLLSAAAMPSRAQADLEQLRLFSGLGLVVGLIAHGVISIFVGLLYAVILPMFPRHPALWGGFVAPLLWTGLLWSTLGVINPTLNARIDWIWFIASQFAFGLTAGFVVARIERIETMQTWPLAARAGVEATGVEPEQDR